ncbi:MAG: zf-HC2 domain-containing protein [Candidatus Latescibacterota bacterium]|jgi:hypothetical protein
MKCRIAKKLTYEFIDGLENDTKRLELEQHLASCSECDAFATQLTRSLDLLHRSPRETPSENFAWKLKLRLNQERAGAGVGSVSYGSIIRSWNLRYASAAVAAAVVVLLGGLLAVKDGLLPVPATTDEAPVVSTQEPSMQSPATAGTNVAGNIQRSSPTTVSNPVTGRGGPSAGARPQFLINAQPQQVGWGGARAQAPGHFIGVDLIDREEPLSITRMDSLVNSQLNNLSSDDQIRYLSQSIIMLQQHLIKAHMNRNPSR